jgi:hypothetical protein
MMPVHFPNQDGRDRAERTYDGKPVAKPWRAIAVAGLGLTGAVRETLHDVGMRHATLVRHHPWGRPPYSHELLRIEGIDGSLLSIDRISKRWHHPPYAFPLRLARYAPLSTEADVLDVAVIGTQGQHREFMAHVERTAVRLVEDAIVGLSRGTAGMSLSTDEFHLGRRYRSGWLDHAIARLRMRLFSEWWSVGTTTKPLEDIVRTGQTGPIRWLSPDKGVTYLADPFPWPGTDRLLCEEMPVSGGKGRIVALAPDDDGSWRNSDVILEQQDHHSYPCVVKYGEDTYFLPEAPDRGATTLYRLAPDQEPIPLCDVAPGRRLGDPTLFRHGGRYWIACTDLDIGTHDNLCLLHASELTGPWQPHRCTPAKIDICGARSAGPLFRLGQDLFRPGQDCASTYGAGVVIHRVDVLSPDRYRETVVARLRPDPRGPFPHGLHTLAADDGRVWIDGKRFTLDVAGLGRKIVRRARLAFEHSWNAAT